MCLCALGHEIQAKFIAMNRWIIIISCFFVFTFHATGQQLIFKTYTVEDGLVANPVRCVLQDKKGFIWIGTWEGLSKYDGDKFTNYNTANGLSHNMVNDIYESGDEKLYIAENNGAVDILQHDAITKKAVFQNVTINQFSIIKNNQIIAATDTNGLLEIKNGNLIKPSQIFPRSTYNDITELNDSLLIGGSQGSLRILNKRYEFFSEIKQPKEILTNKIYKDSKKRIWVGTNYGLKFLSIIRKSNQSLSFTLLPTPFNIPILKNGFINNILEDANGNLWIATLHGLVKIDMDGNWQQFSEKDGLPSSNISCIYQDKEKNIWIGTPLGLAKLITKNVISIYTVENGLTSNTYTFLLRLKNNIFLTGTETGTQLFNSTKKKFIPINPAPIFIYNGYVKNTWPFIFYTDNNRFGKFDSLKQNIVNYTLSKPPITEVYCSVMDTNGIIFNGTQTGLVIRFKKKSYAENTFPYRITDLLIDKKGYLWIGTWNNGLYRAQYTNTKNRSDSNMISFSFQNFSYLLPDKNIRCLFEDTKNNIWIGMRFSGIAQLKYNSNKQYIVQHFDLQQGLMSNWTRAIAENTKGCIWVGSDLGIDKLIPADTSFRVFNFSRVNNYFANINTILPESNHSIWFATNRGLVNIVDGEMEKTPATPVYVTSVNLGDTAYNYRTYHANTKVQLKYNQNQVAFEYSAPTFINEKQILYSYHLLGSADTAWSVPTNLHNVSYASLQPSNYIFEVRTKGWNEEWGKPANFLFNIQPPFWKTWWFYLIVGTLVILLFYAFYLYRITQLTNLQKMRNRIASDLHDDIGANLTNINMLSEISRKSIDKPREAEKILQRIIEEVTASGQALNDIIWNVNSRNDSMEEIMLRMRRYAADLFDNSNILCHLAMDENVVTKKLNMEQRRDVYLIYKEAMNNIIKHASASNVWINLKWQSGKLCMKIKDDGKGFEPVVISHRNGLKNIRSRAEKWKGSTTIETAPGKGTLIEIIIPLGR